MGAPNVKQERTKTSNITSRVHTVFHYSAPRKSHSLPKATEALYQVECTMTPPEARLSIGMPRYVKLSTTSNDVPPVSNIVPDQRGSEITTLVLATLMVRCSAVQKALNAAKMVCRP